MLEAKEGLSIPVNLRRWSEEHGLVSTRPALHEALLVVEPQLTDREVERIEYHLTELIESLAKVNGHLPRDVVPTPGKGQSHILNGRLLRKQGIWLGLLFDSSPNPLQITSVNRADPDQLVSIIGGGQFRGAARSRKGVLKFHNQ